MEKRTALTAISVAGIVIYTANVIMDFVFKTRKNREIKMMLDGILLGIWTAVLFCSHITATGN